jgi:hypothetical protein
MQRGRTNQGGNFMPGFELTPAEISRIAEMLGDKLLPILLEKISARTESTAADSYMTIDEVAEKLQKSRRQINAHCRYLNTVNKASKKPIVLPFNKVGKSYRFDRNSLDWAVQCDLFTSKPRIEAFIAGRDK